MSKHLVRYTIITALLVSGVLSTAAAAQTTAQEQAAKLRSQLTEVQAKEAEQQTRLQQLDEALKPENIENSLAGVGSTHPPGWAAIHRVTAAARAVGGTSSSP